MDTKEQKYRLCIINICGLSSCSKLMLEKYVADQHINVLALQET